jgi:hypothetical protein
MRFLLPLLLLVACGPYTEPGTVADACVDAQEALCGCGHGTNGCSTGEWDADEAVVYCLEKPMADTTDTAWLDFYACAEADACDFGDDCAAVE